MSSLCLFMLTSAVSIGVFVLFVLYWLLMADVISVLNVKGIWRLEWFISFKVSAGKFYFYLFELLPHFFAVNTKVSFFYLKHFYQLYMLTIGSVSAYNFEKIYSHGTITQTTLNMSSHKTIYHNLTTSFTKSAYDPHFSACARV